MFNDAWFSQALHMIIAAFVATGFAVAGLHALMILKKKNVEFHKKAFKIAATCACIAALLQPISGDISAKDVNKRQPEKLAAMEAHFDTEAPASFVLGGIVNEKEERVDYAIKIPGLLSFLAYGNLKDPVKGITDFPKEDRPPVAITHYSFQIMIILGVALMILAIIYGLARLKNKTWLTKKWFYKLFVIATPLGYIALEAGWTVTEVGRQPWIIYKIMRTADAVTPMPGIVYSFYLFTAIFISLSAIVIFLLYRQMKMVPALYDSTDKNYKSNKK